MTINDFIFRNKPKHRLSRHFSLWICFSFYFFIVNFLPTKASDFSNSATYFIAFQKMIFIPVSILSVYVSIYFLLPRYLLKGKYFSFFILFICLSMVNLGNAYLLTKWLALLTQKMPFQQLPVKFTIFQPITYGLGLSITASGFASIIKLLKIDYLKQKENERLQQQKINTELQMIKTNFHPDFLSDALKNISYLIRSHSKQSPDVVLSLSDLLSYILYDNEKEWVPMEQEIQMVKEYFNLEKIFYSNRFIVNIDEEGSTAEMVIAPLIILSLIQNCCEQLLFSLQQKLTINISLKAENNHFYFGLRCNGYYESINGIADHASALNQALRRIQALYPGKHVLETNLQNGFFSIKLILEPEAIFIKPEGELKEKSVHETA